MIPVNAGMHLPMTDREVHACQLRQVLSDPRHAEALVAWDRDIAPHLEAHQVHWGPIRDDFDFDGLSPYLWVTLTTTENCDALASPCCHFRYNHEEQRWVRVSNVSPWVQYRQNCPTPELP